MTDCTCKKDIEQKLLERFKAQQPDATAHEASLQGYGFGIDPTGNRMVLRGFLPYRTTAVFPLKKGGSKSKTTTGNMYFSYCPFCGVKQV